MKKIIIWAAVLIVIAAVIGIRLTTRGSEQPARSIEDIQAQEGVPVDVATVSEGMITVLREITGEVSGFQQSTLRAYAEYRIAAVLVEEGDPVRKGQSLLRYDTATSPDRMAKLAQVREVYENARRQVDRLEPLFEEGAIAESDLDAARTRLATAKADLHDARLELEVASPIDGIATLLAVSPGDAVDAGDVVAQVAVLDSIRVVADVSAESAGELRVGAEVYVNLPGDNDGNGRRKTGAIVRVALGADPDTRLFRAEAVLDNQDRFLRPGQIVTLSAIVKRVGPVMVVPSSALLGDEAIYPGSDQELYAVVDGAAVRTRVEVGEMTDDLIEIRSGLRSGTMVVEFGQNRLEDGARVRLHKVDGVATGEGIPVSAGGETQ